MKKKHDAELRDFSEIYGLVMQRAAERAEAFERDAAVLSERIDTGRSSGRVLREDVTADRDIPPYDRVAVDGYACRKADLPGPLRLAGAFAAGDSASLEIGAGQCAKVMTGGVLPSGADTVVMVEQSREAGGGDGTEVSFSIDEVESHPPNYSPQGEDIGAGETVLRAGTILGSHHTALLASVGYASVSVARLPRVGILSTGNEVVEPDRHPEPHQIRNANAPQTAAQLGALGIEPSYYGIVPDEAAALNSTLNAAARENDLIIMSGGISMGDWDLGPEAMEANGFSILFDRVAVKPGRPTTFAVSKGPDLFALPGNPVSCFVMFEVLVKPYLYRLMGAEYASPRSFGTMAVPFVRRKTGREEWVPVTLDEYAGVRPLEYHGSGHFLSIAEADGMIKVERGQSRIEKGATVAVRQFR